MDARACPPLTLLTVIVNYRTAGMVAACLEALVPQVRALDDSSRVVVVDNASGDDSVTRLNQAIADHGWGDSVELLVAERNGGFAWGNNRAIRPALASTAPPDAVLLLNPDTIPRDHALQTMAQFMRVHPEVGILGSRLEHPDGSPQTSAFRFPGPLSELEQSIRMSWVSRVLKRYRVAPPPTDEPHPTDWVAGASMMIRREVFDAIGLMDERYFMYYEEVDFCRRAREVGWPCWYVPEARVVHLVGKSSGVTDRDAPRKRRPAYWFESRQRYFRKQGGRIYAALADVAFLTGHAVWRLRRRLQGLPEIDPPHLVRDLLRHSVFCRSSGVPTD